MLKKYKKLYKKLNESIKIFDFHIETQIKKLNSEIIALKRSILELNLQNKLEEARKLQLICDHKETRQDILWGVSAKLAQCLYKFGEKND